MVAVAARHYLFQSTAEKTCRLFRLPTGRINLAVLSDGRYQGVL